MRGRFWNPAPEFGLPRGGEASFGSPHLNADYVKREGEDAPRVLLAGTVSMMDMKGTVIPARPFRQECTWHQEQRIFVPGPAEAEMPDAPRRLPAVPESQSPDAKLHAVMDIDRDATIKPEWKGDSYPQIEITERAGGKILLTIPYFGSVGDDTRPLREHLKVHWRQDARAFAITVEDRFYSYSKVYARRDKGRFSEVAFPDYQKLTGFPAPKSDDLRPRCRSTVEGWDEEGHLIYGIWFSPGPAYEGKDPMQHRVLLQVTPSRMTVYQELPLANAEEEKEGNDKQ